MIPDYKVQQILRLDKNGAGVTEISRATGVAVNTVYRYKGDPARGLGPRPTVLRHSCLDDVPEEDFISMYEACGGRYAPLTFAIIDFMKGKGDAEFAVSASAVRRYALSRYPELQKKKPEPVIFYCEPGQQVQIDFVNCEFRFSNQSEPTPLKVFEAVYPYSRRSFVLICPDLTQKSWLTGIVQCLAKYGIPRQILCDNDIGLVRRGRHSGKDRFNPRFAWLCDDLGVTPKACRPYRPETKGRVERFGGTFKNSCLKSLQALVDSSSGVHIFNTTQLQQFIDRWIELYDAKPRFLIPGSPDRQSVNALYEVEREFLLFPPKLAQWTRVATKQIRATPNATVHLHGIRFHIPPCWANATLEVTFRADGGFFISSTGGLEIRKGVIPAENLSSKRWDERAPDPAPIEAETTAATVEDAETEYFEMLDQFLNWSHEK